MNQKKSIGEIAPKTLRIARLGFHHALQSLSQATRTLVPKEEDDSHSSFTWEAGKLKSQPFQGD